MMILTIAQFFVDGYWTFTEVFTGIQYMIAVHPEIQVILNPHIQCLMTWHCSS